MNIIAFDSFVFSLSLIVTLVATVAVAAFPDVFWFPAVLTPGKFILADPSNDTPPIVRAVVKVAAEPVVF